MEPEEAARQTNEGVVWLPGGFWVDFGNLRAARGFQIFSFCRKGGCPPRGETQPRCIVCTLAHAPPPMDMAIAWASSAASASLSSPPPASAAGALGFAVSGSGSACPDPTLSQICDGRHVAQLLALLSEGEPTHEGWTGAVVRHCHKRGSAACAGAGAEETAGSGVCGRVGFCNKILCD